MHNIDFIRRMIRKQAALEKEAKSGKLTVKGLFKVLGKKGSPGSFKRREHARVMYQTMKANNMDDPQVLRYLKAEMAGKFRNADLPKYSTPPPPPKKPATGGTTGGTPPPVKPSTTPAVRPRTQGSTPPPPPSAPTPPATKTPPPASGKPSRSDWLKDQLNRTRWKGLALKGGGALTAGYGVKYYLDDDGNIVPRTDMTADASAKGAGADTINDDIDKKTKGNTYGIAPELLAGTTGALAGGAAGYALAPTFGLSRGFGAIGGGALTAIAGAILANRLKQQGRGKGATTPPSTAK